ncbi:glycoside hydrolase family 97 protein [Formosa sp. PL04]|uniref:glycoside hydrolase family 97 protein n=1 Tax=Formosa sp. PL04 TaxID=3081755 RepID=UPI0029817EF1|nr:glycoside hydrolase family 97 catalytic domain-containing protein [Formosa sp. PL04]MDW5289756.1 glycoside hydrolase family 97 catalytic domain-containing protein [Formosa sp. PL04]
MFETEVINFRRINSFLGAFIVMFSVFSCSTEADKLTFTSPDQQLQINLNDANQLLKYSVNWEGEVLITNSEVSILQDKKVTVLKTSITEVKTKWEPVWGQFSQIENHYNEMEVALDYEGTPANLYIRAYNNGVAFRFVLTDLSTAVKPAFFSAYDLPKTSGLYSPSGETKPLGPINLFPSTTDGIPLPRLNMPVVVENPDQPFIALLESDLASAPGFGVITFNYNEERDMLISNSVFELEANTLVTPWRLILIENNIGDLVTNTISLNVAAPNKIKDPSWIKPGKTMWDWRVHGYKAEDGFTYGIDNESYYRFIDFASENGIEYFLIDDSWYTDVSEGHIEMSDKLDLEKVSEYAKNKGVSLILYYDRIKGVYGDEALFPYYRSLGMSGIKYGFMGKNVSFSADAIRMSAESELLIDFHDSPVPFTGISRTFPNAITREYCHAQQDSRRAFTPESFIRMALINAIQGPLDMNNGIFDITGVNAGLREKGPKVLNSLVTTATAEVARTLIVFSGLVCIPDAPEAYAAKQDLFEFIKKMPVGEWDESKVLHAKMDDYISTARRHNQDWYIGSVHSKGGTLDITLDFLDADQNYAVTYYEDTDKTDGVTNPEAYQIREDFVKKGDVVKAKMALGGGHCMWIRPAQN